jgi:hypothetical protein
MAVDSFLPLYTRIVEVMGGAGAANPLPVASRFRESYFGQQSPSQSSRDAHERKRFWTRITDAERYPAPEHVSQHNLSLRVVIELSHFVEHPAEPVKWRAIMAESALDMHRVRLALCSGANLAATTAGADTGLAGGVLEFERWTQPEPLASDRVILVSQMSFTALISLSVPA